MISLSRALTTGPLRHTRLQWPLLLLLSMAFSWLLFQAGLSAALLLGPLIAGIFLAVQSASLKVPQKAFYLAQGTVGAMIATNVPLSLFPEIGSHWPTFAGAVVSVLAASCLLGYLLARWQVLPDTTAIWGSFPGAATAMTLMAGSFGADVRLVAFMQYTRVLIVALVASGVARATAAHGGGFVHPAWFEPIHWLSFAETLAMIVIGVVAGKLLRVPAGPLLVPMALGILLSDTGLLHLELPYWLLGCCYALVGWTIGLRFTQKVVQYAIRALPRLLLAVIVLVSICGGFAALLVKFAGVDPLTAYLAMSPGGVDSVAIIAASSPQVDMSFVMSLQMARFLAILIAGPAIARMTARALQRTLAEKTATAASE